MKQRLNFFKIRHDLLLCCIKFSSGFNITQFAPLLHFYKTWWNCVSPILFRNQERMDFNIKKPAQFKKRVRHLIVVGFGYIVLVKHYQQIPIGIFASITSSLRAIQIKLSARWNHFQRSLFYSFYNFFPIHFQVDAAKIKKSDDIVYLLFK